MGRPGSPLCSGRVQIPYLLCAGPLDPPVLHTNLVLSCSVQDIASPCQGPHRSLHKILGLSPQLLKEHMKHHTSLSITKEAFLPSNQGRRAEPPVVSLAAPRLPLPEASNVSWSKVDV